MSTSWTNKSGIQVSRFSGGGFVLHSIRLVGYTRKFSAWYDDSGHLIDCETIDSAGRSYPASAKAIERLIAIGQVYNLTAQY
jgi:hypothetical protein